MKFNDMKRAVELLENEWNLGEIESGASGRLCAWIYLFELLEETEQFVYFKEKGKLLGFAGYSKWNSKKHKLKKKIYNFIKNQLYKSKKIKNVNALKNYESNYDYVPDYLRDYFDGELSILILDKSCRGKGLGKKLLLDLFDLAKKDNLKNLQILSDESCDYKVYEFTGCRKIYQTIIENKEYKKLGKTSKARAFIYEKKLN